MINDQKNNSKREIVQKSSDTFKLIQFKLQLALGTSSAIVKSIYDISNTHVSSNFNSYAKGSIVLQSFIDTEKLVEPNKLEKINEKGFQVSHQGMIFNIGYNRKFNTKSQKQFSFLMTKIAVGKSYCYPLRKYKEDKIDCPQGFESIYLYQEDENPQVFMHQYVIFKTYQVYPTFLIDFVIDNYQQSKLSPTYCQNCTKVPPEPAKFYCITQEADFCYQCDAEYHSSKLSSKHQRIDISLKPKNFGICATHQVKLDLYCKTCSEALCINCKISGDHSTGEMAEHSISKLKEAYNDISSKVKEMDPNLERRKNQLTEDLSKIDLKIKEVNTKATNIEEQLYALFQRTLNQLQFETQRKLSFLIGDQLQLKRQYDHILWMESFVKYQLDVQEPNQFLSSWYKYSKYKKDILSLSNLSINTEVKADMILEGDIHVICGTIKKRVQPSLGNSMYGKQEMNMMETPAKDKERQRDIGSTQLRKTIFKKHYIDRMSNIGSEPPFAKLSVGNQSKEMDMSNLK